MRRSLKINKNFLVAGGWWRVARPNELSANHGTKTPKGWQVLLFILIKGPHPSPTTWTSRAGELTSSRNQTGLKQITDGNNATDKAFYSWVHLSVWR